MKLSLILFLLTLQVAAKSSYSQTVSLHVKDEKLGKVLKAIEQQTGYRFTYSNRVLPASSPVTLDIKEKNIREVLDILLQGKGLDYREEDAKLIVIFRREAGRYTRPGEMAADTGISIHGRVMDGNTPLSGVSVTVKGGSHGTSTDAGGAYSITASKGQQLVFSHVDYETQEVAVGNSRVINVLIVAKSNALNDVVVVGYGTRKKTSLTGSVSSVSAKDIQNQVSNNVLNDIAGQMAGVQVISTTGKPGASPIIRIRGTGSIGASNQPLYVVDGMPLSDASDLNQINSTDIETMDVLKEASAAAIYGSRGSNGVVLITTKKGKAGQSQLDLNYYAGMQDVPKKLDMMDRNQEVVFWKQGTAQLWSMLGGDPSVPNGSRLFNGSGLDLNYLPSFDNPSSLPNTDWQNVFLHKDAPTSNYQLDARGGTDKVRYFASGDYLTQDGVVKTTGFKRYTGRINVDANVNKMVRLGMNFAPSYSIENVRNTDAHINSPDIDADYIMGSLVQSTTLLPKDPATGQYGGNAGSYNLPYAAVGYNAAANPLQIIENPLYKWTQETFRVNDVAYLELEPVKGLVFHTDFGVNITTGVTNKYRPSTVSVLASGTIVNSTGAPLASNLLNISSSHSENRNINYVWNNTLTWTKTFDRVHSINLLGGYAFQKAIGESSTITGVPGTFQNDAVQYVSAATSTTSSTGKAEWSLLSYFGRANYTYKDKIIVDGSLRSDGSNRFGMNKKYALFPAAGLAWRVSQEPFLQPIAVISNLKLRVGYGKTGNTNIGNYASLATLSAANYNLGNALAAGFAPGSIANPDLTWETTTTTDGGMDISLLKSRLNFSFDYYNRATNGLLYGLPIPAITGFTSETSNIGNIRNRGIELSLTSLNINKRDFQWSTSVNFAKNKNRVMSLGTNNADVVAFTSEGSFSQQLYRVGQPMGIFYGYKLGGIFKDQADVDKHPEMRLKNASGVLQGGPGDSKIVDANHDGQITIADKTKLGDPNPNFTYGISNHFSYKGFDLDIQVQGVQGNDVEFLGARFIGTNQLGWGQLAESVENRWISPTQPGNGIYPRISTSAGATAPVALNETQSDRWLRDASYLRVRNITLGYKLPVHVLRSAHITSVRIYASVENLHTFTKYLGYNPDVDLYGENPGQQGIDYATYPLARTFTLGANISL